MTLLEQKFIIWACLTLLGVIAFIGVIFVKSFMQMAKDVNEIKTTLQVHSVKHENLEARVDHLERIVTV